jgi:hypothetical protein
MFRSLMSIVVLSSCFVQAKACDACFDEEGYYVEGGVVVGAPGSEYENLLNQPACATSSLEEENPLDEGVSQRNQHHVPDSSIVVNDNS